MGERVALSVGINDYPGTGADLSGCVNDALDWSSALYDRGWQVTTLLDSYATKTTVLSHLTAWAARLKAGDRAVLTYSGHGTWIPDRDGDEPDRRDEALCLHDYLSGGLLVDDELAGVYASMRAGVRFTIISDSCHSGSVSRLVSASSGLGTARFLPPALFLTGAALSRAEAVQRAPRVVASSRPGTILLSGCADAEFSYDAWFGDRPNGAFTRAAIDALGGPERRMSVGAWHRALTGRIDLTAHPQHPQLTANRYQRLTQALR